MLGDVRGRIVWGESEVLRFPADEDEAKVHHILVSLSGHGEEVEAEAEQTGQEWSFSCY